MITLEIIKDIDFYFLNKEIKKLETKYKKNATRYKNLCRGRELEGSEKWNLERLRSEINEKKFILSTRYLKKKLPDELIYEIYKFL